MDMTMFQKRLLTQAILIFGMIVTVILFALQLDVHIVCTVGGIICAIGIIYSIVALRCPCCHCSIPISGFYIEYCPVCGAEI